MKLIVAILLSNATDTVILLSFTSELIALFQIKLFQMLTFFSTVWTRVTVTRQLRTHISNISALAPGRYCGEPSERVADAAAGRSDGGGTAVKRHLEQRWRMTRPSGQHLRDAKTSVSGQSSIPWMLKPFWVPPSEGAGISISILLNRCDSGTKIRSSSYVSPATLEGRFRVLSRLRVMDSPNSLHVIPLPICIFFAILWPRKQKALMSGVHPTGQVTPVVLKVQHWCFYRCAVVAVLNTSGIVVLIQLYAASA